MRRLVIQAVGLLLATAAIAQEDPPALMDLAACRIDDEQILVSFRFDSSPCWETTQPVVTEGGEEPAGATIAIGTEATSEICVMMIEVKEVAVAVPVAAPISAVAVSLTNPTGEAIGGGTIAVAEPGEGCEAPTAIAAAQ